MHYNGTGQQNRCWRLPVPTTGDLHKAMTLHLSLFDDGHSFNDDRKTTLMPNLIKPEALGVYDGRYKQNTRLSIHMNLVLDFVSVEVVLLSVKNVQCYLEKFT